MPDRSTVDRDHVPGPAPTPDLAETDIGPVITDPALDLTSLLVGDAAKDSAVGRAAREVYNRARAGETPVGLVRLSEVLTPSVPSAPAPRHPVDDPDAIVEVVRRYPCAGLNATGAGAIARALAAVLADGRRVVVTGTDAARLTAVREALPASLRGLCIDGELPLTDAEFRELRWLLVTETPERRSRSNQVMPDPELVPSADRIAQLCRSAGRHGYVARDAADLIPGLLGDLDPARLAVLIDTARRCTAAISEVNRESSRVTAWGRSLLERVLFGSARPSFERLLDRTRDIVATAEKLSAATDRMGIVGDLPPDALEQLNAYAHYLESGGKARSYFRSQQQRDVEPTLRHLQLDGEPMKDPVLLRQVIAFIELIRSMDKLRMLCQRLEVPPPVDVPAVAALDRRLTIVRDAVARTEELRREVLFMHPESPVSMPDLDTTERVAEAIARHGGPEHMRRARAEIADLAEALGRQLDGVASPGVVAPEADAVLDALREMNVADYARALSDLTAARRQHHDQHRLLELTSRLRDSAPELAATWQDATAPAFTSGTARFVPLPELLVHLPAADTADLVVMLDSDQLDAANLLVSAAAPRLLAVGAGFAGTALPDRGSGLSGRGNTVVTVLRRAGVPIVLSGESSAPAEQGRGRVASGSGAHAASVGAHAASVGAHAAPVGAHALADADRAAASTEADRAAASTDGAGAPAHAKPDAAEVAEPAKVAEPAAVVAEPVDAPESAGAAPTRPTAGDRAPSGRASAPTGRRPLTEEEAAFMVMPLGIVPRQAERPAIEQTSSEPEDLSESESESESRER